MNKPPRVVTIRELERRVAECARQDGKELHRTKDDDPEDWGLHALIGDDHIEEIVIERYAEEHGLLDDDEYVAEWY